MKRKPFVRSVAWLAVALIPTLAAADEWKGVWASDPSVCQYKDMIGEHDPTPILYSDTRFIGYEVACDVDDVRQLSQLPAWHITLSCQGEGMTYDEQRVLMVSEDGRLWEFDGIWEPFEFIRCD